ncbi:bifunctional aspartate kinase/homoserine dehydrogenase I [Pyxidicoccus parkwayensis]|uniref:Bifunctional aspartate kinase/homoserine dehydrogenase I n=1 Tax=Pyxidicoccus parkwayensis TaxID=2813578 RepID=A0ABX7NJ87_9BACT|nr:bifunctional aspartate kinase/homoserine dehydrogenase I [Pyxidicoccus parkwaysis]QSQ18930.1 bifunctional aspartate kinase/homoserine dehydrogenase I [Pyxidicoccus parkwaysis]
MRVMKFGGTSVGGAQQMRRVVDLAAAARQETRVMLVASAVSGITNLLIDAARVAQERGPVDALSARFEDTHAAISRELAGELGPARQKPLEEGLAALASELRGLLQGVGLLRECSPSVLAHLSGLGERAACLILEALLEARGLAPKSVDPREVLICSGDPLQATPMMDEIRSRFAPLRESGGPGLMLMPGFFGGDGKGKTLSLGRGGSDYSAALAAAALDAELLEIWTDVDGIFSADPRMVPEAFPLPEVSFEEAMELAYFGAKVLHPKTISPARERGIPVRVCNSFRPEHPGTRVTDAAAPPQHPVRGLSFLRDIALINIAGAGLKGVPGTAARVFEAMAHAGISVVLITQGSSECSISFCVQHAEAERAVKALEVAFEVEREAGKVDAIERTGGLAILSIVGDGMRHRVGVAGTFFSALADVGCSIAAIAQGSSERSISAVISETDGPRAMAHVHGRCFGTTEVVELLVAGVGSVGGELLRQVRQQAPKLRAHGVDLRVCAIANSRHCVASSEGIPLEGWEEKLAAGGGGPALDTFRDWARAKRPGRPIFVDCTSSEDVALAYPSLMEAGLHVVTANKKANAGRWSHWRTLRQTASRHQRRFLYETNVGAALPVIDTLKNMVRTGDTVLRIEGILSGSLSFILGLVEEGVPLSQAVGTAMERRFTEPDPRDDLQGTDVARKVLILARELGRNVELEGVKLESLLPADFDASGPLEAFLARLPKVDESFQRRAEALRKEGKVLRYVGSVTEAGCSVGLVPVPLEHPLAAVKGGENALSFLSERYSPTPLVIRGYGAGAAVTAAGVLADVLRLVEGPLP